MQAVILAAGKSTRTYPLTITRPKPVLKIANKTILDHNLEKLEGLVDEVIIVSGYKSELIEESVKDKFNDFVIRFVEQKEQNGTGGALRVAEKFLKDRFIVMNGDDLFSRADIERCIQHETCVLAKEVDDLYRFGEVVEKDGFLAEIIEKPDKQQGLANTGFYVLNTNVFNHQLEESPRGEFEIIDFVTSLKGVAVEKIEDYWLPISYPWNVLEANEHILSMQKKDISGTVEDGVTLKGEVVIGEGTVIKSGAYIEGPVVIGKNCIIGPNCFIRSGTTIGDGSKVGNGVDIKNAVIGEGSSIAHLAYIGDSVIGDNVNVAAGVVTANLRHDKETIKTPVKGEMVDTNRKKLGAIIGDGVNLGINTAIYPGRKIWPHINTMPGQIVDKDIE